MGALLRFGLKGGDAVGPYRVTDELWLWPEHRFYRAVLPGHDRPFLLREFVPQERDPARLKRLCAREAERYGLARGALCRSSPHHLTFADYVDQDGGFAVFAHRDLDRLAANAASADIGDEEVLRALIVPVLAVLRELHAREIICAGLRAEEILIDPEGISAPVFAGLQHVYHLRGVGPKRPERIEGDVFAPEFAERQKPLTYAADVYALAALIFSLFRFGDSTSLADERAIEAALLAADPKRCPVRLQGALIASLKHDPAARPQSIADFEELAFGVTAKRAGAAFLLPARRISALLLPLRQEESVPEPAVVVEAEGEAVPPWPPIRALLDAQKTGGPALGGMTSAAGVSESEPLSEIEVAARGLVAALKECALAPWQLARSMAGEGAALMRQVPNVIALGASRARAIASAKWPEPVIAAVAIVVAISGAAGLALLKPLPHARSATATHAATAVVAALASADDLVRLPSEKREELAVQDDVLSVLAARALEPQMLTLAAEPVMIALPAPRPVEPEASAPELQSNPALRAVQAELKRLRLYGGMVDGIIGVQTRAAILTAQQSLGEEATGEPSPQLLVGLQSLAPSQVASIDTVSSKRSAQRDDSSNIGARAITRPLPDFPTDAFQQRVEGWIEVAYDVDPRGNVEHARVIGFNNGRAREAFEAQALAAIDQAVYAPARKNGKPIWSRGLTVRYQFNVVRRGWGPFRSREPRSSIVADSSGPSGSTLR
ncbi:MAG: TonB family protein [Alphaproteobacteria bacterium]